MLWGMKTLRTPDERFRDLPGFPFAPHYTEVPGTQGQPHTTIRGGGHFLQEGRGERFARIVADFVKSGS